GRRIRECGCLASYKEVQSRAEMMTLPVMREKLASCRALWTGFRSPNLGAGQIRDRAVMQRGINRNIAKASKRRSARHSIDRSLQ
ncbi:MAG: hypothetical protein WCB62_09250, partial [Pseudolabrys sp.]